MLAAVAVVDQQPERLPACHNQQFGRVDPVPVRALAEIEQEQDRGRQPATPGFAGRGLAEGLRDTSRPRDGARAPAGR